MSRFQCTQCTKTYAGKGGLKQHMDKHHPEPGAVAKYVCGFCDKIHACKSNLERHKLSCKKNSCRIASGSDACKFKCNICGHGSKQKANMLKHQAKCILKAVRSVKPVEDIAETVKAPRVIKPILAIKSSVSQAVIKPVRKHGALYELQQSCMDRPRYLVCGKCTTTCQCPIGTYRRTATPTVSGPRCWRQGVCD